MSEPQQDVDQEEEQDDEEEEDDDNEDEEQDDEQQQDEDDQDQQDDQQGEDQDQNEDEDQNEKQQVNSQESKEKQFLPSFKKVPPQFQFKNLTSEIFSLQNSVDNFISTLPSHSGHIGSGYSPIKPYRSELGSLPYQTKNSYRAQVIDKPNTIIMKDQDIQVSMQPQIVIQPTIKKEQIKQPYRVSNESEKFLAQLYEQNKKLKRWKNVSNSQSSAYEQSKERFERKEYEKGLFNVEERNKQIDEAIQLLRKEQ